jgi:hypothetical protein
MADHCYDMCCYAERRVLFIIRLNVIMLSVVMLSVVAPFVKAVTTSGICDAR